jgi:hypothetical protein
MSADPGIPLPAQLEAIFQFVPALFQVYVFADAKGQ